MKWFVAGALVCSVVVSGGTPANATFVGGNGVIAFGRSGCGTYSVHAGDTIIPDARQPAWSPDGAQLVYGKVGPYGQLAHKIMVVDADGANAYEVASVPYAWDPAWSPDGMKIVFGAQSTDTSGGELWVVNADGTERKNLTPHSRFYYDESPTWSPDGTQIAFETTRNNANEIFVMNADGTGAHSISGANAADFWPDWSPDGSKITFWSSRRGVMVMNVDGTERRVVVPDDSDDSNNTAPVWSPNGQRIAFSFRGATSTPCVSEPLHIASVKSDGTDRRQETSSPGFDGEPSWQPSRVNTTGDLPDASIGDGKCEDAAKRCSLRAAIEEANAGSFSTVAFGIKGEGVHTITLTTPLPPLQPRLTVDATTQRGYVDKPLIKILAGPGASGAPGFVVDSHSTIRGLVINGFATGIQVMRDDNHVEANYVGPDESGAAAPAPNEVGILVRGPNNVIGGTDPAARNVISGNRSIGILIEGSRISESGSNRVQGNRIGTRADGNAALENGGYGVFIADADKNLVGGDVPGAGNLVSGNRHGGVRVAGDNYVYPPFGRDNRILGNRIGTNAAGTAAVPNNGSGVDIGAKQTQVGGPGAAGNLISGNRTSGVYITTTFRDTNAGNTVRGNLIGTDAAGRPTLGNGRDGVQISIASGNKVGGLLSEDANVIAGNHENGIGLDGSSGTTNDNAIMGNSIFENDKLGIDLGRNGANRCGDSVNRCEFPPAITLATKEDGTVEATEQIYNHSSHPASWRIELFASDSCDPSGFGEGPALIMGVSGTFGYDERGTYEYTQELPSSAKGFLTATMTYRSDTSEFSRCIRVGGGSVKAGAAPGDPCPATPPCAAPEPKRPQPGSRITVSGDRMKPGTQASMTLRSDPVALGNADVDAAGTYSATVTIPPDTEPGPHTIHVDGVASDGTDVTQYLDLLVVWPTTTTLTVVPEPAVHGVPVLFAASVSAAAGPGTPTGTVSVYDGNDLLGSASVIAGYAVLPVAGLDAGTHKVVAVYEGDEAFSAGSSHSFDLMVL